MHFHYEQTFNLKPGWTSDAMVFNIIGPTYSIFLDTMLNNVAPCFMKLNDNDWSLISTKRCLQQFLIIRSEQQCCIILATLFNKGKLAYLWNGVLSPTILLIKNQKFKKFQEFSSSERKKPFKCPWWCIYCPITQEHDTCCPVTLLVLKSGQLIANQIWEFCDSYD